jgi:sulfur carrier protein ThiS
MKKVRVAKPSMTARTVEVVESATVADCIAEAGFEIGENEKVQVNGTSVELDYVTNDNDVITIAAGAKGNMAAKKKTAPKKVTPVKKPNKSRSK